MKVKIRSGGFKLTIHVPLRLGFMIAGKAIKKYADGEINFDRRVRKELVKSLCAAKKYHKKLVLVEASDDGDSVQVIM